MYSKGDLTMTSDTDVGRPYDNLRCIHRMHTEEEPMINSNAYVGRSYNNIKSKHREISWWHLTSDIRYVGREVLVLETAQSHTGNVYSILLAPLLWHTVHMLPNYYYYLPSPESLKKGHFTVWLVWKHVGMSQ